MVLIFEGDDLRTRSELARSAARRYSMEYRRLSPHEALGRSLEDHAKELMRIREYREMTVLDGSFLGHRLSLGRDHRERTRAMTLLRLLQSLGARVVLVDRGLDTARMGELPGGSFLPVHRVHVAGSASLGALLDEAMAHLRRDAERAREHLRLGLPGVGDLRARHVLVGEAVNPNTTWLKMPFDDGPSARYLGDALLTASERQEIYLTNARQEPDRLAEELRFVEGRSVALGNVAHDRLREMGVEHVTLPHPQFWRRFHYREVGTYRQMLAGALA